MAGRILIGGALARRPGRGGHAWVFLQYLLGFRRLGWEVFFLDHLEPEACVDAFGRRCEPGVSEGVNSLARIMERFGLGDSWAVGTGDGSYVGPGDPLVFARSADLLWNVNGYIREDAIRGAVGLRIYVDIDPGFGQIWSALGLSDPFAGHDRFVTVGLNLGSEDCSIPACGLTWFTTPPPVVLDQWPYRPVRDMCFTTVASWRGSMGPLEYQGQRLGLRVHEFRRFMELPRRVAAPFRIALDIHDSEHPDLTRLRRSGWDRLDPRSCAGDPSRYRSFIADSGAEIQVAKELYVRTRSGWFSDRSACYLASGRPVVAQQTGFGAHLPTGLGLLAFNDLDEAEASVRSVLAQPRAHSRAARELAAHHFDSDRVLGRLLLSLHEVGPSEKAADVLAGNHG